MNNRVILLLGTLLVFSLIFLVSEVRAEDEANIVISSDKNVTYGTCVSDFAKIKNPCFNESKQIRRVCLENAGNDSVMQKTCKLEYKENKKECKNSFKESKQFCKQYKKKLMERFRGKNKE